MRTRPPTFGDHAQQLRCDQLDDFSEFDTLRNNRYEEALERVWRARQERERKARNVFMFATTQRDIQAIVCG